MKEVLEKLTQYRTLTKEDAKAVLTQIGQGSVAPAQIAVFISVYMMRTITVEELNGFIEALIGLCKPIDFKGLKTIDMCGTGGDGKDTFNISTTASFVVAGAGVKVTKHGNYGVSSSCGSSNVLEYLGYKFTTDESVLSKQLEEANLCILHAPLFHPAMKEVAPVRKALKMKTFFNMLGPLVNPCKPAYQSVGVFNLEVARLYKYLFQSTDKKYSIVHSLDGYDEVSLTGPVKVISNDLDTIYEPKDFDLRQWEMTDLAGGSSVKEAANTLIHILQGDYTQAQKEVVLINSAIAIQLYKNISLDQALAEAEDSLDSGAAMNVLKVLVNN